MIFVCVTIYSRTPGVHSVFGVGGVSEGHGKIIGSRDVEVPRFQVEVCERVETKQ